MKFFIISALAVACLAEPPVDNRYLPPQQGGRGGPPSTSYGTPLQRQTDAVFSSRQPSRRPSNQYIPPQISSQYGPPSQQQYTAPSAQYGVPEQGPQMPDSQYGVPSAPSSQYGTPGFGGSDAYTQGGSFGGQAQSRQYLPPGAGARGGYGGDEYNSESANYNFEYMVKDEPSGNDFGHRESRQGDRAEGVYYVLLPDGRKQTVKYEADENGYKPRISYEDTGLGQRGYGKNSQSGYNYDSQGY